MSTRIVTIKAGAGMYARGRLRKPRLAVIHGTVTDPCPEHARSVAHFFGTRRSSPSSAHVTVDGGPVRYRSVADADTAYAAPGANGDGLHVEGCFRPTHSKAKGAAFWSGGRCASRTLDQMAETVAEWCHKYGIPRRWLTAADVRAGRHGICDHYTCTRALGGSHWDVGAGFPVRRFMGLVEAHYQRLVRAGRKPAPVHKPVPVVKGAPRFPLARGHYLGRPSSSAACHSGYYSASDRAKVKTLQRRLTVLGYYRGIADGMFGARTELAVRAYQKHNRLAVDGKAGAYTWASLWRQGARAAA